MGQGTAPALTVDVLRTPERAASVVADAQQDTYRKVLAAYAKEELAHPDDAALAMAHCQFTGSFGDSEDIAWADAAEADGEACLKGLEGRFHGNAEVSLYIAGHRYGKDAISFAHGLLPDSGAWTSIQRSRLHAVLARGYQNTGQASLAGQEALASVQLDPSSDQLVPAMRYLCSAGRSGEAEVMLARAPAPSHAWMEGSRVRFAADSLGASAALAELQRAQAAKISIDPWLTAHVYQRAGRYAQAAEALGRVKVKPANQTAEQLLLRVNVAAMQNDGVGAATALKDWFGKTGITAPLVFAYGTTLAHNPGQLFAPALAPLALTTLGVLLLLACLPGLVAFPAHYRGTVRARLHKPTPPLFAPIGLRHMWLALGAFLVMTTLVPLLGTGAALQALEGSRPLSTREETTALLAHVGIMVMGALFLVSTLRRFSWRDWWGDRGFKAVWVTVAVWGGLKALVLWAASHATHPGELMHGTSHDRSVTALAFAAQHIGGAGLAMLLVAVLVPVYEELVFRGFVLGGLSRHLSFGWSNLWQALLFALLHYDPTHFVFYAGLGLLAGWLVRHTRGLAGAMALHAVNNAMACAAILLTG